jgi:hypothetical protein
LFLHKPGSISAYRSWFTEINKKILLHDDRSLFACDYGNNTKWLRHYLPGTLFAILPINLGRGNIL